MVVRGPSGSGKTTLLLAIGGMLRPTSGRVIVGERDVYALSEGERARFRAETIGFVFQMFHLVPYLTALENVLLARGGEAGKHRLAVAEGILERLRLAGRSHHRPSELSAGEKQRVALARALLGSPRAILADEPTGNLDEESAAHVMDALGEFRRSGGAVILVTHGSAPGAFADRIVSIRNGRIEGET